MTFASRFAAAALPGLLLLPGAAVAQKEEPGVTWEQTVEMQAEGFAMPPTTVKVCAPRREKDWKEPPKPDGGGDCKVTDVKRSGSTMSWKMTCAGERPMKGEGEMTWSGSGESYTGLMRMTGADGTMKMKMRGKLLGTPCDTKAQERQANAIRQQAEQQQATARGNMAAMCAESVQKMQASLFVGPVALCKENSAAFCERVPTREGYLLLQKNAPPEQMAQVGKLCKVDVAAVMPRLCAEAGKDEAKNLDFIGRNCPGQARLIAQRECAGRKYTSLAPRFNAFCSAYAQKALAKTEDADEEEQPRPRKRKAKEAGEDEEQQQQADPADAAKKKLKGLFGF